MFEKGSLAAEYEAFLESVFSGIEERALGWAESLSEVDLQSLWFAGEFGMEFTTTDGRKVTVRDFGTWNHGAGPDFTGCAVLCEGETLKGSIELDPDARDWERHGHGANAAYEDVALHLYMNAPEARVFTRTTKHREVSQVHLKPEMLRDTARPRRVAEARLGRCAMPLAEMEEMEVMALVEAAAQYRLSRKGEKLHTLARIHGREQAIYQSLAVALGYKNNQRAFTVMAQRLPLKMMLKLSLEEREAMLFGVSGFLESVRYEDTQLDSRTYLRGLWSEWWKRREAYANWLTESNRPPWVLHSTRPGNHPQRRIGALSALIGAWNHVYGSLDEACNWCRKTLSATVVHLEHPYWSKHYTLLANPATKPIALIGGTRVQEMLANVAYPLFMPESPKLWDEYKQLSAKLDNQKVRRAALRLFGESERAVVFQKKLFQQQGLLQIYEDYCLEDDSSCAECPFPEKLKEWRTPESVSI